MGAWVDTHLASGVIDGRPWTLSAGPGETSEGPSVGIETSSEGGGLSGSHFGVVDVERPGDVALSAVVMHGNTFLYGGVPSEASRLRVTPEGAEPFDVPLYDLPASLDTSIRAYVAPMVGAPRGTLTTYDSTGTLLAEVRFSPGEACWADLPCQGASSQDGAITRGRAAGVEWALVEEGGGVDLIDGDGNVLASVRGSPDPLLVSSAALGSGTDAVKIPFGIASPPVTSVVLFTDGLPSDAPTAVLGDGRVVFWAPFTPPSDDARILAFDASCRLLGAVSVETGEPSEAPAAADCET